MSLNSLYPPFILKYGPPGSGKTTDDGYSGFDCLYLAGPGALTPVTTTCGYDPLAVDCPNMETAIKIVAQIRKDGGKWQKRKINGLKIDDFSFMAEQTYNNLEEGVDPFTGKRGGAKLTGFKLWGAGRSVALDFRNEARYAGLRVTVNCWLKESAFNKETGKKTKGGPKLPGDLPESMAALADLVVRVTYEANRWPWPWSYNCFTSPDWVMKDRFNVLPRVAPMNEAEVLRFIGRLNGIDHPAFMVPWPLDWMGPMVEQVVDLFDDPKDDKATANAAYTYLIEQGADDAPARWVVRDAVDRVHLHRAHNSRRAVFAI